MHKKQFSHVSASQLKVFSHEFKGGCNRRWYFEKVLGLRSPETPEQRRGTDVHDELERWMRGEDVALSLAAGKATRFLPKEWRGKVSVEREFPCSVAERLFLNLDGVPLTGRIDLLHNLGETVNYDGARVQENFERKIAEVTDYKTANSLFKRPAPRLATDPQMVIYGAVAIATYPHIKYVRLSHIVIPMTGAAHAAVKYSVVVSVEHVLTEFQKLEAVIPAMREVQRCDDPLTVPGNDDSCSAFKGCPFRERCGK